MALTRRRLLRDASALGALAGGAAILSACESASAPPRPVPTPSATPLPPPETTTLRIFATTPPTCEAPIWVINDLLRDEGFTDIKATAGGITLGDSDIGVSYANHIVTSIDVGFPWVALAGCHTGCIELWAAPGIATPRDLRGKAMDVFDRLEGPRPDLRATGAFYGFLLSLLSQIGMEPSELRLSDVPPQTDIRTRFLTGQSDAMFAAASGGALLRRDARVKGHRPILDTTTDKPWSQYLCCLLIANGEWMRTNPVASKRATRAFLRASDLVSKDKRAAVQKAVDAKIYANPALTSDVLFETIEMLSYDWREYDPEETMRFYAQRLLDIKAIKKSPQQIMDHGASFAYTRQLAKELKP
jgi:NitT/TauT family transport system substrate-binding protein